MNTLSNPHSIALADFTESLQLALTGLLIERPEGWTEHDLIKVLIEAPYDLFDENCLRDSLTLFRTHFLLFHSLYRLRDQFHQSGDGTLEISPLKIQLVPYRPQHAGLITADPLRDFYLDWGHFDYNQNDVDRLLNGFWERFLGAGSSDQKQSALRVMGLTEPTDYQTIKRQYRRLAMKHHPDRGGDPEELKSINDAMFCLERWYRKR